MSLPTHKFGNINIKIGGGAKISAKNTIIGASQVNLGGGSNNKQPSNIQYGDVNVEIADNAEIVTESLIAGAGEVNIAPAGSFLSIFNGDQSAAELFKAFGVRVDLPFNADKKNEENIKEFMKNDPPQILTLVKSICLVLGETTLGTGFLATVPDYDGVILFSAGHNFMPNELAESYEDFWNFLKKYTFYFNCLDGNPQGKGVTRIKYSDLMHYNPKVLLACQRNQLNMDREEPVETDKEHDYFALVLNKAAKDDLAAKYKLEFLSCPDDWTRQMDHPRMNDGEPLFYAGYPVIDNGNTNGDGEPLRFSFGNCQKGGSRHKINYDMDTKGGASGAPVLNANYKVVAIHTKKDSKKMVNIGNVLKSVYEELKNADILTS